MKKILIFQWFDSADALRKSELIDCIEHNLGLGFDNVVIFNDSVKPPFTPCTISDIGKTEFSPRPVYVPRYAKPAFRIGV